MGFVPNKCQIGVDGATAQKKKKQKACPIRVDWLGGYFFETAAVYIIKSPFKGMLVRYFLF